MRQLRDHQKNVLAASMNMEEELDTINHRTEEPINNVKITKTKNNMIQILTENMAQMEARIKQLEEKDIKNTKTMNAMQEKIQEMTKKSNQQRKQSNIFSKSNQQAGFYPNSSPETPQRKH